VERLTELRRHLDHLKKLRPRITGREDLERDLSARRGDRFEDYTQAVRNLARDPRFSSDLVRELNGCQDSERSSSTSMSR